MKYLKKVGIIILILSIYINFVGGAIALALNDVNASTIQKENEVSNITSEEDIESVQNNTPDNQNEDILNENTITKDELKEEGTITEKELLKENSEKELIETKNEIPLIENNITASNSNEKELETGFYQISTAVDGGKVLDIDSASKNNQANVQIWQNNGVRQQKFKVIKLANGYYEIVNCRSSKALDVAWGEKRNGANVQQYSRNNSSAQKWILESAGDGYYYVKSVCNGLYLDISCASNKNGTNVQVYEKNGSKAQKFKFTKTNAILGEQTIKNAYYIVNTAVRANAVLDISAGSNNNGANLQIWSNANVRQQMFRIEYDGSGCYTIRNVKSKKYLDVAGGGNKNGTNVWQYDKNNTEAQNWMIQSVGNGYYNIISECNGLYLDVECGCSNDGRNVQVYEGNGSQAQKFKFTEIDVVEGTQSISDGTYKISMQKNANQVLDIDGGATYSGANVQIWSYANALQQKFIFTYVGDGYYTIKNVKSGKYLDVCGGSGYNGANVWQYDYNGSNAQKWVVRPCGDGSYNIISACQDAFLDVSCAQTGNGTNVQVYEGNNSQAQKFYLDKVTVVTLETGTYGTSGKGQSLRYYKIGNGPNVYFATFAVHGWEDLYSYDGQALTNIAESFKNKLIDMQDEGLANKWTIYIFPSVNPDGEYQGWSHNGPGRTTLYSMAPSHKGIDVNRCWSTGYTRNSTDRNYNGTEPFQAYEARALRDFLLSRRATNGQTVLVDLHGWLRETLGDNGIGSYYRSNYGMSKHISSYGNGYLINWARNNLGYNGRTARSCLVELPEYDANADKYINATLSMLRDM